MNIKPGSLPGDPYEVTAETRAVGTLYINRYLNLRNNLDDLLPLLTDVSVFEDHTAALGAQYIPSYAEAAYIKGGKKIVAFFKKVTATAEDYNYAITEQFFSSNYAFYYGTMSFRMQPSLFGIDLTEPFIFEFPRTTILQVVDGKVMHHWDFVNFFLLLQQLIAQCPEAVTIFGGIEEAKKVIGKFFGSGDDDTKA